MKFTPEALRAYAHALPLGKELHQLYTDIKAAGPAAQRALARVDRFYLLAYLLKRPDVCHPWLYERCREVEKSPDGHLDLWAREHYKSTIITFAGIIQEVLRDPEITIGIFSHMKPNANKFLSQIKREFEHNRELVALFPDILWADPRNEAPHWSFEKGISVKRKTNPKEPTIEACGLVDGMPTGAHYLLRVYDDVVTPKSVSTPEQVQKTTDAYELSDNLGARGPDGLLREWVIGTRYTFADTYQHIIDKRTLKVRIHAATDNGKVDGAPVFLSPAAWAEKVKKQSPHILAAQQLQNPAAGTQAMFSKDWLRFTDIRPATLNVYVMVDPASSKKKQSDKTAMVVLGIDAARNKYLLDGYHHKMSLSERWTAMYGLRLHWMRQPGVQHVKVGYERFGMRDGIEYFEEKMQLANDHFEIVELAWTGGDITERSKYDRIQRLEPDFRAGKVYLIAANTRVDEETGETVTFETANQKRAREAGEEWRILKPVRRMDHERRMYPLNKGFLDEYLVYPFSQHDDFLDAMSRIYDMDPQPPILIDETATVPQVYGDGI